MYFLLASSMKWFSFCCSSEPTFELMRELHLNYNERVTFITHNVYMRMYIFASSVPGPGIPGPMLCEIKVCSRSGPNFSNLILYSLTLKKDILMCRSFIMFNDCNMGLNLITLHSEWGDPSIKLRFKVQLWHRAQHFTLLKQLFSFSKLLIFFWT